MRCVSLIHLTTAATAAAITVPAFAQCLDFTALQPYPAVEPNEDFNGSQLVAADFNLDNAIDIAVARNSGELSLLLNNAEGEFELAATLNVVSDAFANAPNLFADDFDLDGDTDILAVARLGGAASLLTNDGRAGFTEIDLGDLGGSFFVDSAIGDMNGDGATDLIYNDSTIRLNDGTGAFPTIVNYPFSFPGGGEPSIAVGDVNGDGELDIVGALGTGASNSIGIAVTTNIPNDGFKTLPFLNVLDVGIPNEILLTDVNADGVLDFVLVRSGGTSNGSLVVFIGNGTGEPTLVGTHPLVGSPGHAIAGDFDLDGRVDLAVPGNQMHPLSILRGDGAGDFEPVAAFAPDFGSGVALADFDGDGRVDVAGGNGIIFNQSETPVETSSGDLNGDGLVNGQDLLTLLNNWTGNRP